LPQLASYVAAKHAALEASPMLHLDPARVRLDLAEAGDTTRIADLMPRLRFDGVRAVSANGVLGDPGGASADQGAELFEGLVGRAAWPHREPRDRRPAARSRRLASGVRVPSSILTG
jgi:creatinine amidohydrolase/Fe(II)-dependent formamide hydrolase-like protein